MHPERTRELVEAYRHVEVPPAGAEDRMLEGLRARVASGAAPDAAVDLSPAAVVVPSRAPWLVLAGAGTAAVVAVAVALLGGEAGPPAPAPLVAPPTERIEPAPAPEPPREEVPQVVESREVVADTDVTPEAEETPELDSAPARPRTAKGSADPVETVDAEVDLIKRARGALRDGDAKRALRLLGEHRRRFARGVMVELREVFRVEALCELGRTSEAAGAARTFLERYPSSPYAGRVNEACGE